MLLPTEKASNIHSYMYKLGLRDNFKKTYNMNGNSQISYAQHLYILSDEEIKERDWYYNQRTNEIKQAYALANYHISPRVLFKIVATTDKFLKIPKPQSNSLDMFCKLEEALPQLPELFIQAFIKAYNEDNPITEVDLEMEERIIDVIMGKTTLIIKTRPDNTVIVHPSKMYTRDEVLKFLKDSNAFVWANMTDNHNERRKAIKLNNEWIQDNL